MGSRQDQLHAHQYGMERVVAALVTHDPDPERSPFRRVGSTTVVSALVAVIALGGMYLYAKLSGTSAVKDLRVENTVFIEQESGAQYVYYKPDGKLHPVLNYASGLLIAGSAQGPAKTVTIHRANLAKRQHDDGVQVGAAMGIPDAPNALPAPADLIKEPWHLCTRSSAGADPKSLVIVGSALASGHSLVTPPVGATGEALLVEDPSGNEYLIFGGHRFLIRERPVVHAAFGWGGREPYRVAAAWINAVPAGPDVEAPHLEDHGTHSDVLGKPVGQLYQVTGGTTMQWAVARRDGFQYISEVQAKLLAVDPINPTVVLTTAALVKLPQAKTTGSDLNGQDLLPRTVPTLVTPARSACVTITDATTEVTAVRVDPGLPSNVAAALAPGSANAGVGTPAADYVSVPLGRGVLVEAAAAPGAPIGSGTISVVAGGLRYPIATPDTAARLGYQETTSRRMPAALVALLPEGPALNVDAAVKPAS